MSRSNDFTGEGTKIIGQYENDRNSDNRDCFKAVLQEAYGVQDVIIGHHLIFVREEPRVRKETGTTFQFQLVEEIPSADALIFDHEIAKRIWGLNWQTVLMKLALEPPETRDDLFRSIYDSRPRKSP